MLLPISNTPNAYGWGSTTLLAALEGRAPTGAPEAEVWFGDHPADPAVVDDASGVTLDRWLETNCERSGAGVRLPYLLKILAAASPLSIQVHPTKTQAEDGFAREEGEGIARDAPDRSYRDANHKPEIIVALSDPFLALAGLRPVDDTLRLLDALGGAPGIARLRRRLSAGDPPSALSDTLGWLLSGDAADVVADVAGALPHATSPEFADELDAARRIAADHSEDPGLVVALLMNLVALRPGEAVYTPAGAPHAYLEGLGVELMAASDNVLRGGLTPKHIDVAELLRVLDARPAAPHLVRAAAVAGSAGDVVAYPTPAADFQLLRARPTVDAAAVVPLSGTAIAVAVSGAVRVGTVALAPGRAVLITPDETPVRITGEGVVFVAEPGV